MYIKELGMKVYCAGLSSRTVTGGDKFNAELLDYFSSQQGWDVKMLPDLDTSKVNSLWGKIKSYIRECSTIKEFDSNSVVFFGDTSFGRHLLLCIGTRLFSKAKSMVLIHHFQFLSDTGLRRVSNFLKQYCNYSFCRYIVVPSPYTYSLAKKLFPWKKIHYVPLFFDPSYAPSEKYVPGRLLFVGTIEKRKGVLYLIEALNVFRRIHPDATFSLNVVGKVVEDDYYRMLLAKIEEYELGGTVRFLGRVSNETLESEYNAAEIFVFPSLLEGFGMVLIEAMRHGIPVIAFDNSAMPYTIRHGVNGLLAKNKDERSIAMQLERLLGNAELRHQLQKGVKETVENVNVRSDFETSAYELCKCICGHYI